MKLYKYIFLGLMALLLVAATLLICYGGSNMRAERALKSFSKEIEKGNLGDISITIYFYPNIFTSLPWSIEELIKHCQEHQDSITVVDGVSLSEHADLLRQLGSVVITPIKQKSLLDARIYYVFETKQGKKILDVAMWGSGDYSSIFVNGVEVEESGLFYRVLVPFLPDEANWLETWADKCEKGRRDY